MAMHRINGANLHVEEFGGDGPPLVFIHGLMLASESWAAQVAAFAGRRRTIVYDLRGQGRSEKTVDRLDLDSLAEDAAALIETLDLGPSHVVGFSMGGFVAMRLAARRPDLVRSLTLIGPSADAEDAEDAANLPKYRALIGLVRVTGVRPFVGPLLRILFGKTFLGDPDRAAERGRWRRVVASLPRSLHRAAAASARRAPIRELLPCIAAPTLVVSGTEDRPIPPARAQAVAAAIAGARFVPVPATGHAVMIERPDLFNDLLEGFLDGVDGAAEASAR